MGFESVIGKILSTGFGDLIQKTVGSFKADPTKALELQADLTKLQLELQGKLVDQIGSQIEVNKAEAASTSTFVAGWRPWIGWVCGMAIAIQYLVGPLANWGMALAGKKVSFPSLDVGTLWPLITGMLGFGGFRTYEKVKGVPGASQLK